MEASIVIKNKAGLHARPASLFVQTASKFSAAITVIKDERETNAKSILGIMGLGVCGGDKIIIKAEGLDAQAAINALTELTEQGFGEVCFMKLNGISASNGIAIGPAIVIREIILQEYGKTIEPGMESTELARFEEARLAVKKELADIQNQAAKLGKAQAEVVAAHLMMVEDPTLIDAVNCAIRNLASAEHAVENAIAEIAKNFSSMNDAYMQERAVDIKDIGRRILRSLQGLQTVYNINSQGNNCRSRFTAF